MGFVLAAIYVESGRQAFDWRRLLKHSQYTLEGFLKVYGVQHVGWSVQNKKDCQNKSIANSILDEKKNVSTDQKCEYWPNCSALQWPTWATLLHRAQVQPDILRYCNLRIDHQYHKLNKTLSNLIWEKFWRPVSTVHCMQKSVQNHLKA